MHLLYLDDAGSVGNPQDKRFVLAGIAVFERQAHWLQTALDRLAETLALPSLNGLSFTEIRSEKATAGGENWGG